MIQEMTMGEYLKKRSEEDILVDLRSETLYQFGSIPEAVNIPIERISELYQLPREKNIYLFCQVGEISGQFAELLSDAGYTVCNLTGGYMEYLRSNFSE